MTGPEVHDAIERLLRRAGQRYTSGRRRLIEALRAAGAPLTLPQLLVTDATLAQSSAYRNLAVLEQAGVVTKIVGAGDYASYELAEDLTGHHHHHLVCSVCGDVSDFALTAATERHLDRALTEAAKDARYEVETHRLDVVGRCGSCR